MARPDWLQKVYTVRINGVVPSKPPVYAEWRLSAYRRSREYQIPVVLFLKTPNPRPSSRVTRQSILQLAAGFRYSSLFFHPFVD